MLEYIGMKPYPKWAFFRYMYAITQKFYTYIAVTCAHARHVHEPQKLLSFFNISKNMNFIFCKLKNSQKTWISFFASLKTWKSRNLIFASLKTSKKMKFLCFASLKKLKNIYFILYKLKKPQKTWISFFCKFKKLQKTWIWFLKA